MLTILVGLALVSVPLFALVGGVRWMFCRVRAVPMLHVRVLPLCAWPKEGAGVWRLADGWKGFLVQRGEDRDVANRLRAVVGEEASVEFRPGRSSAATRWQHQP